MLTINNLDFYYFKKKHKIQIFKKLNVVFTPEYINIIRGNSGVGKTTLLNLISGIITPCCGNIIINDIDISQSSDKIQSKIRNQYIGYIFQDFKLLPHFNIIDNIMLPYGFYYGNKNNVRKRAEELLDYLNILDKKYEYPNELSGGEIQRAAVARALILEPQIILADEPTGNLDSENETKIFQLFLDIKNKIDSLFILTTHKKTISVFEGNSKNFIIKDHQLIKI